VSESVAALQAERDALKKENARLRHTLERIEAIADDTDSTGTEKTIVLWCREALRATARPLRSADAGKGEG
jgi:hypothetical protein